MQNTSMLHNNALEPPSIPMPRTTAVSPAKRLDDDDIQFISSKPVKRRKISDQKYQPECCPPQVAVSGPAAAFPNLLTTCDPLQVAGSYPNPMLFSMPMPMPMPTPTPTETKTRMHAAGDESEATAESERRLSTGMVGLPSDMEAVELTYGIRGVSLPVLENFVLDQPPRGPRPASSPELSPKQLPLPTFPPATLNPTARNEPLAPGAYESPDEKRGVGRAEEDVGAATTAHKVHENSEPAPTTPAQLHVLNTPINDQPAPPAPVPAPAPAPTPSMIPSPPNNKNSAMPPPPMPRPEPAQTHESAQQFQSATEKGAMQSTTQHVSSKPPCQVCARLRQQANMARAQGIPMMQPGLPPAHQLMPQMPCHQAYGQHLQPHPMGLPHHGMHPFAPGFPMMMPVQGNNFPNFAAQILQQVPPQPPAPPPPPSAPPGQPRAANQNANMPLRQAAEKARNTAPTPTSNPAATGAQEKDSPKTCPNGTNTSSATATVTATAASKTGTAANPVKPPPSLIQPTYRKPSPNLIVDVAETCQERFPFEEVARRHGTPVERVFDVFAALIKVPLLRCPTDRRRAGKLATARVREYARARKDVLESRGAAAGTGAGTGTGTGAGGAGASGRNGDGATVTPHEIAQHMGPVEFPEGFSLENGRA